MLISALVGAAIYVVVFTRHRTTSDVGASMSVSVPLVELPTAVTPVDLRPLSLAPMACASVAPVVTQPASPHVTGAPSHESQGWDGTRPFGCSAFDNVTLTGVTASLASSIVVSASGYCKLHLVGVHLTGRIAVYAAGSSEVTIDDSTLEGTMMAVEATGDSHVVLRHTAVTGRAQRYGAATLEGL
jgi:hypothetical protein